MKGIISGVKRMEIHDGAGLRSTVFFKGCPLRCRWCHNPESLSFEPQTAYFAEKCLHCGACGGERNADAAAKCPVNALVPYGEEIEARDLAERLLQDEPFFQASGGGVTLSGGECLAQIGFAAETARLVRERGVGVDIDTCGCVPRSSVEKILPYADTFLYDLKAMDPDLHRALTGRDNALILDNLRFLASRGADVEIRYPLVVGCNDGECAAIGAFLKELGIKRIKVLRYHDLAASRYEALGLQNTLPPPLTTLAHVEQAVKILSSFGLDAVNGALAD